MVGVGTRERWSRTLVISSKKTGETGSYLTRNRGERFQRCPHWTVPIGLDYPHESLIKKMPDWLVLSFLMTLILCHVAIRVDNTHVIYIYSYILVYAV